MQVHGYITDKATGESLPQANIFFSDRNGQILPANQGTAANENGFYQMSGEGNFVTASYTGFTPQTKSIGRQMNPVGMNFQLAEGTTLQEFTVIGFVWWPRILAALILLAVLWYVIKKL